MFEVPQSVVNVGNMLIALIGLALHFLKPTGGDGK